MRRDEERRARQTTDTGILLLIRFVLNVAIISGSPGILERRRAGWPCFSAQGASAGSYRSSKYCDSLPYVLQSAQMQGRTEPGVRIRATRLLSTAKGEVEFSLRSSLRSETVLLLRRDPVIERRQTRGSV